MFSALLIKLCIYYLAAGTTDALLSQHSGPPYPKNIQCYWEIPKAVSYTLEFGIFVLLGLSGKAPDLGGVLNPG